MGASWRFVYAVMYRPVTTLIRTEYRHIERIPERGPVIIVVNHVSHADPFSLAAFIVDAGRLPRFLAKDAIFKVPVVGHAMRALGQIPVHRGSTDARQSLTAAMSALQTGHVVVMHPEGTVTRDPDGWPMAGRTGAARLATLVPEAKVVPVAQWGVQEQIDLYKKKFKLLPRPRHVISVGNPIDFSGVLQSIQGRDPTMAELRKMTDEIMRRLRSDVAELRGLDAPTGELYRWTRSSRSSAA